MAITVEKKLHIIKVLLINELEMWKAETLNPVTIDCESQLFDDIFRTDGSSYKQSEIEAIKMATRYK